MLSLSLFDFCPELVEMISNRRVSGRSGKVFEGLGGLSSVNNLVTLRNLCLDLKPQRSLAVGLCFGASALLLTGAHREAGKPANRQHVALDPFQSSVWDDAGLLQIEGAGLGPFLDFRSAYSSVELPHLLEEGTRFDLIYVDGSHLFEDVFLDAYYSCRLLTKGGVVAFDDCSDHHVAKVIRFLQRNCRDGLRELDLEPYRTGIGQSLRYRSARLLGRIQMRAFRCCGKVERVWNAPFHNF
jgi:predicted O-methyltransferase YrrM